MKTKTKNKKQKSETVFTKDVWIRLDKFSFPVTVFFVGLIAVYDERAFDNLKAEQAKSAQKQIKDAIEDFYGLYVGNVRVKRVK